MGGRDASATTERAARRRRRQRAGVESSDGVSGGSRSEVGGGDGAEERWRPRLKLSRCISCITGPLLVFAFVGFGLRLRVVPPFLPSSPLALSSPPPFPSARHLLRSRRPNSPHYTHLRLPSSSSPPSPLLLLPPSAASRLFSPRLVFAALSLRLVSAHPVPRLHHLSLPVPSPQ